VLVQVRDWRIMPSTGAPPFICSYWSRGNCEVVLGLRLRFISKALTEEQQNSLAVAP
jgi:hypothetical protein